MKSKRKTPTKSTKPATVAKAELPVAEPVLEIAGSQINTYECKSGHRFQAAPNCFVIQFNFGANVVNTKGFCPYCVAGFMDANFGTDVVAG